MALDEAILESVASDGEPTLRFYAWEQPTLSLGYFQAHRERDQHEASRDCPLVRRASGGGAILHDKELTYSLTLPTRHPLGGRVEALYGSVHTALIQALSEFGIAASLCDPRQNSSARPEEPFLCFQRRSPGDVLVGKTKIAGSAQRRRGGAVLLHGCLLLARSDSAPELDGLRELGGVSDLQDFESTTEKFISAWTEVLMKSLQTCAERGSITAKEGRRANQLAEDKYGNRSWIQRR